MIKVLYKCTCMDKEAELEVPNRPENADLMVWMGVVQSCLGMDHSARSPLCRSAVVEYVKIPVPEESSGLGMKPHLSS